MQTFTLCPNSWVRRLVGRNGLVRASDRLQAAILFILVVVALCAVPVAGAVGTAVYDNRVHSFAAQRLLVHPIEATATGDSTIIPAIYQSRFETRVDWQVDGRRYTDVVRTSQQMTAGDHTTVWVDAAGARSVPPPSDDDAVTEAVAVALTAWAAVAGACAAVMALLTWRLDRARYAAWDRELEDLANGANGGHPHRRA